MNQRSRSGLYPALFIAFHACGCAAQIDDAGEWTDDGVDDQVDQTGATEDVGVAGQALVPPDTHVGYMAMGARMTLYSGNPDCTAVVEYGNVFAAAYAKVMIPRGSNCARVSVRVAGWNGTGWVGDSAAVNGGTFNVFAQATAYRSNLVGAVFVLRSGQRDYTFDLSPLRPHY